MPIRFDRTLEEFSTVLGASLEAERAARAPGFLQRRDPRAKILSAALLLLAVALARRPGTLAVLYVAAFAVAAASRLPLARLLRREWLIAGVFTGVIALPALFTAVTPGPVIVRLPGGLGISSTGVEAATRLLLRAVASIHIALTLTQTTRWNDLLAGLRGLGVPATAVTVLALCHRYIHLLVEEAREMLLGRAARRVGRLSGAAARREIAASAGALLLRSQETGMAVHAAMTARGYRGETRAAPPRRFSAADWSLCVVSAVVPLLVLGADRHALR